jgi:hypothetical protein
VPPTSPVKLPAWLIQEYIDLRKQFISHYKDRIIEWLGFDRSVEKAFAGTKS